MKRVGILLLAALGLPLLPSCVHDGDKAVLLNVLVEQTTVVLPHGGSVQLPFVVQEADYSFDLQQDVYLYPSTGSNPHTTEFSLVRVERGLKPGSYIAVLADSGLRRDYFVEVLLGVRDDSGVIIFSAPILCCGDQAGTRVVGPQTGLPVLYVNTDNDKAVTSKTDYVGMELSLLESEEEPLSTPVTGSIRGRGNTTWTWPKKPYLLRLDKKASLLGMPAHKRWVLLANFMTATCSNSIATSTTRSSGWIHTDPACRCGAAFRSGSNIPIPMRLRPRS